MATKFAHFIFSFYLFLNVSTLFAQSNLNDIYFNLPLTSSKDSIQMAIKKYGFINEKVESHNSKISLLYSGCLDSIMNKQENSMSDKTSIQLGLIDTYATNKEHKSLIIRSIYDFTDALKAKTYYHKTKNELLKILKLKPIYYNNTRIDKRTEFSQDFSNFNDQPEAIITFQKKKDKYVVTVEYKRKETGRKRKESEKLVYKEIESSNIYSVGKLPVTKFCQEKNDASLNCFKNDFTRQTLSNLDINKLNLNVGSHLIELNFVIDKKGKVINIKVDHQNDRLKKELKKGINLFKVFHPAKRNGKPVDYKIKMPITINI